MYRKNYCTTPIVATTVEGAGDKMLNFYIEVFFYVVGKAMKGKLSCPGTGLMSVINNFTLI